MTKCTLIDREQWRHVTVPAYMYPGGGAVVRGQLAYISSSEKCFKCVIIHNISINVCIIHTY